MSGELIFAIAGWIIGLFALVSSVIEWDKPPADFDPGLWCMLTLVAVLALLVGMGATCALIWPIPD